MMPHPLQCGQSFSERDVVVINGSEEEVKKMKEAMSEKRAQAKLAKVRLPILCSWSCDVL